MTYYCTDFYPGFVLSRGETELYHIVVNMAQAITDIASSPRAQYEAQEILKRPREQIDQQEAWDMLTLHINNMCPPFMKAMPDPENSTDIIVSVDEENLRHYIAHGVVAPLDSHDQVLHYLDDMQESSFKYFLWINLDRPEYALFSLETDETNLIWTELHWEFCLRQYLNL